MIKTFAMFFIILLSSQLVAADDIYKTVLLRAAPGKLLELIELLQEDMTRHADYGLEKPVLMRHSQGDQWDLLLMIPITSIQNYYQIENTSKRQASFFLDKPYGDSFYDFVAYHEDLFVAGPDHQDFKQAFERFDYYHVEMFIALPGKQKELLKQREMENVYLKGIVNKV